MTRIPVYSVYDNAGHSPLALGSIVSYAKSYKNGVLNSAYEFVPSLLKEGETVMPIVEQSGPGVFLCSNYLWTSEQNLECIKAIKRRYPASITVVGGPSVPKYDYSCRAFLDQHPYVDIAARGEGEVTAAQVLERLAVSFPRVDEELMASVLGIAYRTKAASAGDDGVIMTRDRERIEDVASLPSPYLNSWFRHEDTRNWESAIIETNRGCPYGCTFCDWGSATLSKVRKFPIQRVEGEIEWIAQHGIRRLWIADANFGIFRRDIDIASMIASCRRKYGCPEQVVVNYAKSGTDRIAEIVAILRGADIQTQGIISIQTQDPQTLKNIRRSNIKTERYEELIHVFRKNGLPVGSDLMIGLPGATVESFMGDLQFFFDRKVYSKAYDTIVLPNSPMAHRDNMEEYAIKTDGAGQIVSTYSYTRFDKFVMVQTYFCYRILVGFCVLKTFLYYLQVDHGVAASQFLLDLQAALNQKTQSLSCARALWMQLLVMDHDSWEEVLRARTASEWTTFYRDVEQFVKVKYGIDDPATQTALLVQSELRQSIPDCAPRILHLTYDFVAYFDQIEAVGNIGDPSSMEGFKRLQEYGPGILTLGVETAKKYAYSPLINK